MKTTVIWIVVTALFVGTMAGAVVLYDNFTSNSGVSSGFSDLSTDDFLNEIGGGSSNGELSGNVNKPPETPGGTTETPDDPTGGTTETPDEPTGGTTETPDEPTGGTTEMPDDPTGGTTETPDEPTGGTTEMPDDPTGGTTETPDEPTGGTTETPDDPTGGTTETPDDPTGGTTETPDDPTGGTTETPDEPTGGTTETPDEPTGGTTETPDEPTGGTTETPNEPVEMRIPNFTVLDYNGNEVQLSDFIGKPIVLNFWATWCYYCKQEMADFNRAYFNYPDVQFLMVNATDGYSETIATAKSYVESQGYSFDVFFDTNLEAVEAYHISGFPTTYFITADGELEARAVGMIDYETLLVGIGMITE